MPRRRTIDVASLCKFMERHKEWLMDSEFKTASKSAKVWKSIAEDMGYKLSAGAVYTIFKKNRYNIWEKLGISVEPESHSAPDLPISDSESSLNSESSDSSLVYNVQLTEIQKENLLVSNKLYNCKEKKKGVRTYITFGTGWTHVINEIFWTKTSLPCVLVFKRAKINESGDYFAKIDGECKVCHSVFLGIVTGNPKSCEKVHINFRYSGNYTIEHPPNFKRHLSNTLREEAVKKMLTEKMTASMYRRMKAHKIMTDGSCEPSHLPNLNVLNMAKYQHVSSFWLNKHPIISLSIAKSLEPFKNVIRDIGLDRFFVHYWSSVEIEVYRSYCKRSECSQIAIDATGSVVKKINLPSGIKSKNIFLYEIVVLDRQINQQYSVAHMLSERHDTNSICHWLCEWLRSGAVVPKIIVVDMSLALLSGVAKAFTQYNSLQNYLRACCSHLFPLNEERSYEIPTSFIRLDVSHMVKLISRWKSFQNTIKRTKEFYLRALGQAIKCLNLPELEKILTSLIIVALSETEGKDSDNNPVPCEIEKKYLQNLVATGSLDSDIETIMENPESTNNTFQYDEECSYEILSTKLWLHNIIEKVRVQIEGRFGDRGNQQYLPQFVCDLKNVANFIPLWSAVMVPIFGYGDVTCSSSSAEGNFNDLKNRVFSKQLLPMRADNFVLSHINSIDGGMKLAQASIKNNTNKDTYRPPEIETTGPPNCALCETGNVPSGAHKCIRCKKPVHIIGDCSFSVPGEEEGYGEKRICRECKCGEPNSSPLKELENTENWRGLAETSKPLKKRKWSYLKANPNWANVDLSNKRQKTLIPIIKNGATCGLRPIKINKSSYILKNTCAFDCLVQLLCVSLNDSQNFDNILKSSANETILLCRNILKTGVGRMTYKKRALILKNLFEPQELRNGIKLLSVECSITEMAKKVLPELISLTSTSTCSSPHCKNIIKCFTDVFVSVFCSFDNLSLLNSKILQVIQEKTYSPCSDNCNGFRYLNKNISENYFLLEIIDSQKNYTDITVKLSQVPQNLKIEDKKYKLTGIIGYIGGSEYNPDEIGHYVCFACRPEKWEKYDSLVDKPLVVPGTEKVRLQVLLYVREL